MSKSVRICQNLTELAEILENLSGSICTCLYLSVSVYLSLPLPVKNVFYLVNIYLCLTKSVSTSLCPFLSAYLPLSIPTPCSRAASTCVKLSVPVSTFASPCACLALSLPINICMYLFLSLCRPTYPYLCFTKTILRFYVVCK